MPSANSLNGRIIAPYAMRDVEEFWNDWFSQRFNLCSYTHGKSNSAPKAAYRFSRILRDSASWLDDSSVTDIDDLFDTWRAKMLAVSTYMEQKGVTEAEGVMNKPVNAMIISGRSTPAAAAISTTCHACSSALIRMDH